MSVGTALERLTVRVVRTKSTKIMKYLKTIKNVICTEDWTFSLKSFLSSNRIRLTGKENLKSNIDDLGSPWSDGPRHHDTPRETAWSPVE